MFGSARESGRSDQLSPGGSASKFVSGGEVWVTSARRIGSICSPTGLPDKTFGAMLNNTGRQDSRFVINVS